MKKESKFINVLTALAGILVIGTLVLEMVLVNLWKEIYYEKGKDDWNWTMDSSI